KESNNFSISCCGDNNNLGPNDNLGGSAGFQYTRNSTDTNEWDVKKTITSSIQDTGPSVDGVDHDHDQVWLFLHPKFDVTVAGDNVIWSFSPDQSGLPQYLYVSQLKQPATIPPGLFRDLQTAGFTSQDYQEILNVADPLAQCLPPLVEDRRNNII